MKTAAALCLLGAVLRFAFAHHAGELRDDERHRYLEIAERIRTGDGFSIEGHPTAQAMPLWPALLAHWPLKPHYLAAALSSLTLPLAWLLARRLAIAPLWVLGLMAIDLDQATLGGSALTEPLFTLMLLAFALCWQRGRTGFAAAALGFAALTRPEAFLIPFVLAIATRSWRRPALLLAGVAVMLAPWTVRNAQVFGAFVPFTTTGGITLYAGMNAGDEGLSFRRRGQGRNAHYPHAREMARRGSELAEDRRHARRALDYARHHPGALATTTAAKAMLTLTPVQRKGRSAVYALATLLAWGALLRRRVRGVPLLAPMLAVMVGICLLFLALPRYRAPYHLFVFLVAVQCQFRWGTLFRTNQSHKSPP